jgi:hypothetical protein
MALERGNSVERVVVPIAHPAVADVRVVHKACSWKHGSAEAVGAHAASTPPAKAGDREV